MQTAYVFVSIDGTYVPAGYLEFIEDGGNTVSKFRYGKKYLELPNRIPIDPISLPLHASTTQQDFFTPEGFKIFNGLRDSAPDGWGRHVMDRAAKNYTLSEFDYLVATGEDRIGALAFGIDPAGPSRIKKWNEQNIIGEKFNLSELLLDAKKILSSEDLPEEQQRFFIRGSSLGGTRPKATTYIEDFPWIAKFSREDDRIPICKAEFAAMTIAKNVGLRVPEIKLETVLNQDIYLIKRFDRISDTIKLPFISALTLTGYHESESSKCSYMNIAEAIRVYGSRPKADLLELWKRMVFNILCNNTDDHLRNHGFLWDGKGYRLSPLYDVVPFIQNSYSRYLALGVGVNGREASVKNALSEIDSFGIRKKDAEIIARTMQQLVKNSWADIFKSCGAGVTDIKKYAGCFTACEEVF